MKKRRPRGAKRLPPARTRVLVTDDSSFARAQLAKILVEHGFDVVAEASNAAQAIELYRRLRPDVVTMDMVMAGGSGLDAILALRTLDPKCRVVLVTGVRDRNLANELGALSVPVVPKPPRWSELQHALGREA